MTEQASFTLRGRNPDVLTCIANLSNDEVFTPPELANKILDHLAESWAARYRENIWANKHVRFLDPCAKSGVFLREIASRLTQGLASEFPDLPERVDHILTKQVYGIGITRLTSLLARRSLYCSKNAKSSHSIAKSFSSEDGNVWFQRTEHSWQDGRCLYCGVTEGAYGRGADLETHAYAFIHTDDSFKRRRAGRPPPPFCKGSAGRARALAEYFALTCHSIANHGVAPCIKAARDGVSNSQGHKDSISDAVI